MSAKAFTYASSVQPQALASVRRRSSLMARRPCSMFESLERSTPSSLAAFSAEMPAVVRIFRSSLPKRR